MCMVEIKFTCKNEYIATMFLRQESDLFTMFFFFLPSFLFFLNTISVVNVARRNEDNTLYSLFYGPYPEERTGL